MIPALVETDAVMPMRKPSTMLSMHTGTTRLVGMDSPSSTSGNGRDLHRSITRGPSSRRPNVPTPLVGSSHDSIVYFGDEFLHVIHVRVHFLQGIRVVFPGIHVFHEMQHRFAQFADRSFQFVELVMAQQQMSVVGECQTAL